MKSGVNGRSHSSSVSDLLLDSGKDDDVGVHRHTDGEDDAGDTGQRQGNIVKAQDCQHQLGVKGQRKGCRHTGNPINRDHEYHDNDQPHSRRQETGIQRVLSQLGSHDLRLQLLQLQIQSADSDVGSQLLRLLIGTHTGNHGPSVMASLTVGTLTN